MSTLYEDFSEDELMTLDGLVTNQRQWGVIKRLFERKVALFWDALRLTDIADEKRVLANHKLAVGVESSLGNLILEAENVVNERRYKTHEQTEEESWASLR